MQNVAQALREAQIGSVLENEPLANHTTWRIGGPADVLVVPKDKASLVKGLNIVRTAGVPWRAIGRGSNMLVLDGGIRGVIFKIGEGLDHLHFDGTKVTVGAGYSMIRLANLAGKKGLTGLEFAGGIPGNVGGAVYMNAGAHGSEISRVLVTAEVLIENGELVTMTQEDLEFSYRTSQLQTNRAIVTEAVFQLTEGDRKEISAVLAQHKDRRRLTQPLQLPCAGSVFRNPYPQHAGQLIEASGLKGYRIGGAEVSTLHANFIVNIGKASAQDVLALIEHIQKTVIHNYGVELVPEVLMVGER